MSDLFGHIPTIKAISLWQPWASLVAAHVKRHETRHWSTEYRGLLAIHAAKTLDRAGAPDELCEAVLGRDWRHKVPLGCFLAVANLTRCREAKRARADLTRADLAASNFTDGRYAWELADVRALKTPIPAVGRQALFSWTPPADLETLLGPRFCHREAARIVGWA